MRHQRRPEGNVNDTLLLLGVILIAATALRAAVLMSPYGWLDADEAIVGLMAMHILTGERPLYYWGEPQGYLGALEAYCAAGLFAVFGASTYALKAVPTLFSIAWIGISFGVARRVFGTGPALLTSAYLALPPVMLAVWSTRARGGYAEALLLGELVLWVALALPATPHPGRWGLALGVLGGLAFWTNPLSGVFLVPAALYVLRAACPITAYGSTLLGLGMGALPLAATGGVFAPAVSAASIVGASPSEVALNVGHLFAVSLPVLIGLGPPTAELEYWIATWPSALASKRLLAPILNLLLGVGLLAHARAVVGLLAGRANREAALLVMVTIATLLVLPLSKLVGLVAEPRYALPLYSAVPLYAALLWRVGSGVRPILLLGVALLLAGNLHGLASGQPHLLFSASAAGSTPANRAELIDFLISNNLTRIQADYWLAYPMAFESQERIIPYVMTGGVNRYPGYVEAVFSTPRPAYVVIRDSTEALALQAWLQQEGAVYRTTRVSIYDVVYDLVRPRLETSRDTGTGADDDYDPIR